MHGHLHLQIKVVSGRLFLIYNLNLQGHLYFYFKIRREWILHEETFCWYIMVDIIFIVEAYRYYKTQLLHRQFKRNNKTLFVLAPGFCSDWWAKSETTKLNHQQFFSCAPSFLFLIWILPFFSCTFFMHILLWFISLCHIKAMFED